MSGNVTFNDRKEGAEEEEEEEEGQKRPRASSRWRQALALGQSYLEGIKKYDVRWPMNNQRPEGTADADADADASSV